MNGNCVKVPSRSGRIINPEISLLQTGHTLIYSNNPENLGGEHLRQQAVADQGYYLYKDISFGRTRVFFHHFNNTRHPVKIRVEIANVHHAEAYLYLNRIGSGIHSNPVEAGMGAWAGWATNRPAGADVLVKVMKPGEVYVLQETAAVNVGQTVSGIAEFAAKDAYFMDLPTEATIYAFWGKIAPRLKAAHPDPYMEQLPIVPGTDPCFDGRTVYYGEYCYEAQVRGTFGHCTRFAPIALKDRASIVEMFNRHTSPLALVGEFERGIDRTTGHSVYVANYGVDYQLQLLFPEQQSRRAVNVYLQNPFGSGQYLLLNNSAVFRSCGPVDANQAWKADTVLSYGGSSSPSSFAVWTAIPGGFGGEVQLVLDEEK